MRSLETDIAYQAALDYLHGRIDYERATTIPYRRREFHLDRMRSLLTRLGDPHLSVPVVHVAGTKGKGSTAATIAAILTASGYRTGLYTSPHLDRVEERIAVEGRPCDSEQLVALVDRVRGAVADLELELQADASSGRGPPLGPTYFEITTAMAMVHFADQRLDAAVLEVGLGGRLDSTNVVTPLVSVITSISYDHMNQLGSTLDLIAREKAGIIKPGVPVVSGVVGDEACRAIDEVRQAQGCSISQLGVDFRYAYRAPRSLDQTALRGELDFHIRMSNLERHWANFELSLLGRHQAANAAVGLATVAELQRQGWRISEAEIRRGLINVRCAARVEVISRRPTVIIDTAHNEASVLSLLKTLEESFSPGPRLLLFATTQDKQVREMLEQLLPRFDRVILTRYTNNPRGFPLDALEIMATEIGGGQIEVASTPAHAWDLIKRSTTPEHLVCVTGSFFLAAEIRRLLAERGTPVGSGN